MVIYKITNKINSKLYIGKTIHTSDYRWQQHVNESMYKSNKAYNFPISKAIRKYGKDNFTIEDIEYVETDAELNQKEKDWVAFYRAKIGKDMLYNITDGGNGGRTQPAGWHHTEETKRRISEKLKGKSNRINYHHSQETKNKIGKANSGKNNGMYGTHPVVTDETRLKISRSRKGQLLSDEHKHKLSISHLGVAKGRVAIHKDDIIKYIQPNEVDNYISLGWLKGTGRFKK